jgi:hypothetical protein
MQTLNSGYEGRRIDRHNLMGKRAGSLHKQNNVTTQQNHITLKYTLTMAPCRPQQIITPV